MNRINEIISKIKIFNVFWAGAFTILLLFSCTQTSAPFQTLISTTSQHVYDASNGSSINSGTVSKQSKSCSWSMPIVNIFYYGKAKGISGAVEEAGITKIASVDRKSVNILDFGAINFYNVECIIVTGE